MIPVRSNISGLEGGAFAYYISKTWVEEKKSVIIVVKDMSEASDLLGDISYLTNSIAPGPLTIFPGPSALPYTHLIPQPDTWIERLSVLYTIENEDAPIIVAPVSAFMRRTPPPQLFHDNIDYVAVGQKLDRDEFLKNLVVLGYANSPLVEGEGDFASRGYIIDFWSPTTDRPVRVELDDNVVGSIRAFDPSTQRTSYSIDRVTIIPVRSIILTEQAVDKGLKNLKVRSDEIGISPVERRAFADSIKSGIYPAYTETLLPLFHPDSSSIVDYLSSDAMVFLNDPAAVRESYKKFWDEIVSAHADAKHIERVVEPGELYYEYGELEALLKGKTVFEVGGVSITLGSPSPNLSQKGRGMATPSPHGGGGRGEGEIITMSTLSARAPEGRWIDSGSKSSLDNFVMKLGEWGSLDYRVFAICHTTTQADRLVDILRWQGLAPTTSDRPFCELTYSPSPNLSPKGRGISTPSPSIGGGLAFSSPMGERVGACPEHGRGVRGSVPITITIGSLSAGFIWPSENLVVLTENELFGKKGKRRPPASGLPTEAFTSYQDLEEGDNLVHMQHGVGRYSGMVQMEFGGMLNDFLQIKYLGGDKLYVPAYRLNLVQKYVGPGDSAPYLDKLGGKRWEKARLKANRAVRKIAAELLKLYAARMVKPGFAFSSRDHLMEEFESEFPFDETPDQMQAIEDVIKDMATDHPADRLICGDVGYGKTEVAMRAAFRAAMDGKQVAVLVPTTILAFQHYENFIERFKSTPVNIELLNRFRSRKDQTAVVKGLEFGGVDIVVGTHRLVQKDVKFKDLGLLVIDEEHRFGVRQKEAIKRFRETVDVLSMSATPIPRSLHISLVGARDISIINTPPADRLSIRTYVAEFDEGLIRGAIMKEVKRGGQVFFVHNRVETIESMKKRLKKILPEVRVIVAHGQMKEHQLERVMVAFLKKEYDVLLTTTIIESGLDIQNANTIIVNRADTFGLAQLYQLRGRVGRSSLQAFAYLLIPDKVEVSAIASKRLAALQRYTELGSGFQIAMHDLEIRGSGNILGAEQSGHVSAIGYELYTELLEREIRKQKGEVQKAETDTEIQIPVEAYLPSDYIKDDGTRIVFYKRVSALKNNDEIDDIASELEDRFGSLPDVVKNLLKIMEIKVLAGRLGIESVQSTSSSFVYKFSKETQVDPALILDLVRKHQDSFRLTSSQAVVVVRQTSDTDPFSTIMRHLNMFRGK